MNCEEYQKLYQFEQFYWWHVGRRFLLESFLKRILSNKDNNILEIGCGTGGNMGTLQKWGEVSGLDFSPKALEFCRQRGFQKLFLKGAEKTDFADDSFDVVVALDVLEHIKEEEKAIEETRRILKEGGYFLITVPAYSFLWSEHDIVLGHYRRYSRGELLEKLKKRGFNIIKSSYVISFVFPLVVAYRLWRKILYPRGKRNLAYVSLPKIINKFFILLLKTETILLDKINIPFGTSIICLAQSSKEAKKLEPNPFLSLNLP